MGRRLILGALAAILVLFAACVSFASDGPRLKAESAILVDAYTGDVLYEKDADKQREPASMTKMMTAILVVENLDLDEKVTVSKHVTAIGGSAIGLKKNEKVIVRDLLGAMLVYSANDCAVALAEAISGSEAEFGKLMTKKAEELGCTGTVFKNPNGLHQDGHVSTAKDMAIIARKAISYPEIAEIVQMTTYQMKKTNKRPEVTVGSSDRLLFDTYSWITVNGKSRHPYYKYAKGIKTGYTPEAGGCLATYAVKGKKQLISVVMMSTDMKRFADAIKLLEYGFDSFHAVKAVAEGDEFDSVKVKGGKVKEAGVVASESSYVMAADDKDVTLKTEFDDNINAPVKKGDKVGVCRIYRCGEEVDQVVLKAAEDVEQTFLARLFSNRLFKYLAIAAVLILAAVGTLLIKTELKKKKRQKRR